MQRQPLPLHKATLHLALRAGGVVLEALPDSSQVGGGHVAVNFVVPLRCSAPGEEGKVGLLSTQYSSCNTLNAMASFTGMQDLINEIPD